MPRRKMSHSMSENETVKPTEDKKETIEVKSSAGAKVTLVKPMQEETGEMTTEVTEGAVSPKSNRQARPKVGRNFAVASNANSDKANAASEKSEKDEKSMAIPALHIPLETPETTGPSVTTEWSSQQELPRMERLFEPNDNHAHSRPWDFKVTLFVVALFVAVSLGLISVSKHHKAQMESENTAPVQVRDTHVAPAEAATATTAAALAPRPRLDLTNKSPVLPPALSQAPAAPLLDLPAAPQPSVQAVTSTLTLPPLVKPEPETPVVSAPVKPQVAPAKVGSSDLLSIINKE